MPRPVIAFFNNKGGVGKTSLVYHLAWMYAEEGTPVLAADLDPQTNLSSAFLDDERLEELWNEGRTVYGTLEPLLSGTGDILAAPHVESIEEGLHLLVGDLGLSVFEDELSQEWPNALDRKPRAFRVLSAFWRLLQGAAERAASELILLDLGPNLGALNRSALIASDHVVFPLVPDLFSLQGLKNLGPTLLEWREGWSDRLARNPVADLKLPPGGMRPLGYVVMQHAVRLGRPVQAYERWAGRVPSVYAESVLGEIPAPGLDFASDPHCLGLIKHYRSLIPMAQEARKPIFHLRSADGALGAHLNAVAEARRDFSRLAEAIDSKWRAASAAGPRVSEGSPQSEVDSSA